MPEALESAENKGTARAMNSNEIPATLLSGALLSVHLTKASSHLLCTPVKETPSIKASPELKHSVTLKIV